MGNIAPRWVKIASRRGNIGPTQSQRERETERQTDRQTDRQKERKKERNKERKIRRPGRSAPFHIEGCRRDARRLASYLLLLSPLYRPTFALRWAGARLSGVSLKIRSWNTASSCGTWLCEWKKAKHHR